MLFLLGTVDDSYSLFDFMIELIGSFLLYATIAVIAILLLAYIAVSRSKKQNVREVKRLIIGFALGYAVTVCIVMTYLSVYNSVNSGELGIIFYLIVALFVALVMFALIGLVLRQKAPKAFKPFWVTATAAIVVYGIVLLVLLPTTDIDYEPSNKVLMTIFTLVIILVLSAAVVFPLKKKINFDTRAITYAAVCIALAYALSYIKFFSLPQGGSVTFASLLPIMIYSYAFGHKRGVICGIIYGLLQFFQSPQFYQPMQFLLDYPAAFGAIGLAGILHGFKPFKNIKLLEFVAGGVIAVILRYICHVIGGVFVFYSWSPEGYSAVGWSLLYNLFTFADLAIVLVVGVFLFLNKAFTKQLDNIAFRENNSAEAERQNDKI